MFGMGVRLGSMKLYIIGLVVEVGAGLKNELLIVLQPVEQTLLITMVIKIFFRPVQNVAFSA